MENINKIVFLDIDGVMNHEKWYNYLHLLDNKTEISKTDKWWYADDSIKRLNTIYKKTNCNIVISSSHRFKFDNNKDWNNFYKSLGIKAKVIGITPSLSFGNNSKYDYSVPRGCEIKAWMELNKDKLGTSIGKYRNYIILDDDTDMLYWQRNNFIHVDRWIGISDENVEKSIEILNKNYNE